MHFDRYLREFFSGTFPCDYNILSVKEVRARMKQF